MILDTERATSWRVRTLPEVSKDRLRLRLVALFVVALLLMSTTILGTWALIEQTSTLNQLPPQANMEHTSGIILQVSGDRSFLLQTKGGQVMRFSCARGCHASLPHLERHQRERASTDVYYTLEAGDHRFHARYVD